MANETLKELKYNGNKVVTEVARRDAQGRVIHTTYPTKAEINAMFTVSGNICTIKPLS